MADELKVNKEVGLSDGRIVLLFPNLTPIVVETCDEIDYSNNLKTSHMHGSDEIPYAIASGKAEPDFSMKTGYLELMKIIKSIGNGYHGKQFVTQVSYRPPPDPDGPVPLVTDTIVGCKLEDFKNAAKTGDGNKVDVSGKCIVVLFNGVHPTRVDE